MELKDCPNCNKQHFSESNCKYIPVKFPKYYCHYHGLEMVETNVRITYDEKTGRTNQLVQEQQCPHKALWIFRCTEGWVVTVDKRGKELGRSKLNYLGSL